MNENVLFIVKNLYVTKYGLIVMAGVMAACAASVAASNAKRRASYGDVISAYMLGAVLSLVFSRLVYCLTNYYTYFVEDGNIARVFELWRGGHSMTGVIMGMALAIAISSRINGVKAMDVADCVAPGFCVFVAFARLADAAAGQGWGKIITADWLNGTIFAVRDIYGDFRYCVWRMEVLAALAILLVAVYTLVWGRRARAETATRVLALYSAFQIVFESMREDSVLKIEFFRISQIFSLLSLIALFAVYAFLACRMGDSRGAALASVALLGGIALAVQMEFSVDGEGNLEIKYMAMLAGSLMVMLSSLIMRRRWLTLRKKARARKRKEVRATGNVAA